MAQIATEQLVIGTLIKNPSLLLQSDKYQITSDSFNTVIYKYIFWAIENLADGAKGSLTPYEIEQWILTSPTASAVYNARNGKQALVDCQEVPVSSFDGLYSRFQKENLIRDLEKDLKIDTSGLYVGTPITDAEIKIDEKFANSSVQDLIDTVEMDLSKIKSKYVLNDTSEVRTIANGLADLVESFETDPEIGLPLQGHLFNHIVSGALLGTLYIRSAASGVGKSRSAAMDAFQLAFPVRFNTKTMQWEANGMSEKVMIIITEQSFAEIQKMCLAYLTGINESKIKKNLCDEEEKKRLKEAIVVLDHYQENLHIVRVPSPTISLVKQLVRENVKRTGIRYVFYDYIFISPSLLSEFKGVNLRNDEILLMFSDALKQLAVELDIFIMSSTQVNASADDNKNIRSESSIAGSRAVINKGDVGCIMARPTADELGALGETISQFGIIPNLTTDIYKVRGGDITQVRIWSYMDLGTLRRTDLLVTDSQLRPMEVEYIKVAYELTEEEKEKARKVLREVELC